ncbi:MAG: carboxypeptidase M32 [Clostridiales bacterium]|nr:carboxypeptidase M32 [Clostridiales bacterium]
MAYNFEEARKELIELQKKMSAYEHALESIYYDGLTAAPKDTAENRAVTLGILSEEIYKLSTSDETYNLLEYLDSQKDGLSEKEQRMVYLLLKDLREMKKIPINEYVEFQELLVRADDVWHRAKEASDFELFRPLLEKIFETNIRFAKYVEPDTDPYDYCLNKYEEGINQEKLDVFFAKVREGIVPLIRNIQTSEKPEYRITIGNYPEAKQEELSYYLMKTMGLDLNHVGLATTEHPFTISLGSHLDERITTHYHKDDFISSMYSVIHEGGHALYDTGSDDNLAHTVLDGGTSMGIHESQSRFYENIIGRSKAFCNFVFPKLQELFPEELEGKTAHDLYLAVNKVEPSLVRTEADEVTYCLHVMIRYEIEKRVCAGELEVKDMPAEWNRLYKEYLGVDVPDDKHGVLQDSHWSGGSVGYFPSYALGNAYGAQFLAKMKESVDVDACIEKGDFAPINNWNREHIWQYGSLYTPAQILDRVLGGEFSTDYYIDYLKTKCKDIYNID